MNNAGFTYDRMLHTTPDDAWDIIMKVHVRAPFRLVRAAAPYMRIKVSADSLTDMLACVFMILYPGKHREPLGHQCLVDDWPTR